MIDYLALMEHLPVILVVTAVLALLIGVPYLLTTMLLRSGSWGYYNWNGLDLGANIKSIKKINYGDPVDY